MITCVGEISQFANLRRDPKQRLSPIFQPLRTVARVPVRIVAGTAAI